MGLPLTKNAVFIPASHLFSESAEAGVFWQSYYLFFTDHNKIERQAWQMLRGKRANSPRVASWLRVSS